VTFTVRVPSARETPLVVEIPHAGLEVDAQALSTMVAPARCIGRDADLLVDELYGEAHGLGATVLVAHMSRYVCDLNRSEGDVDSGAAEGGELLNSPHGLIWRRSTEGHATLKRPLPRQELERRLTEIYRPYHAELQRLLEAKKLKFGYAVLLCAHSMPSSGRTGHNDQGSARADVVPGSRGRTTAADALIDLPAALALKRGWSVVHDIPYRGGFSTAHYGQPQLGVHAVQVELNRQLYMDEDALVAVPEGYARTRDFCTELVSKLGQWHPNA
jgi:N-formylglutamate deformylase